MKSTISILILSLVTLCTVQLKGNCCSEIQAQIVTLFSSEGPINPMGGLVQDSDGNLYGTTSYGGAELDVGSIFVVSNSGQYQVLHYFDVDDGFYPRTGLTQCVLPQLKMDFSAIWIST
jgi:uncharacterized repeat protein (TIGR03803 family)